VAVKTTVEIPDVLFNETKKYASARGLTFREIVETSLRRTLEQERGMKKPFKLRKASFKGNGPVAGEDWETFRKAIYEGRVE
jgi:hypothetical protein